MGETTLERNDSRRKGVGETTQERYGYRNCLLSVITVDYPLDISKECVFKAMLWCQKRVGLFEKKKLVPLARKKIRDFNTFVSGVPFLGLAQTVQTHCLPKASGISITNK